VATQIRSVFAKLGVASRYEFVARSTARFER
jgi:DNA-binding CsgD family transcriptional regulator